MSPPPLQFATVGALEAPSVLSGPNVLVQAKIFAASIRSPTNMFKLAFFPAPLSRIGSDKSISTSPTLSSGESSQDLSSPYPLGSDWSIPSSLTLFAGESSQELSAPAPLGSDWSVPASSTLFAGESSQDPSSPSRTGGETIQDLSSPSPTEGEQSGGEPTLRSIRNARATRASRNGRGPLGSGAADKVHQKAIEQVNVETGEVVGTFDSQSDAEVRSNARALE